MSSVFMSYCFVQSVTGNDNYLTGNALYRVNNMVDKFRQITYKGYTKSPDSLITDFEKNLIVLMVGRYAYENDIEYLTLIQSVPMSNENENELTREDLPYSAPLLILSSSALPNSYSDNDGGRKSFMMFKKFYNGVTNSRNIDTNVLVFYSNDHGRYNSLRENLNRTVLLAIGRLKIGSNKIPHIVASEIEWNYIGKASPNTSDDKTMRSRDNLDDELDSIEEKYAKTKPNLRKHIIQPANDMFLEAALQVKNRIPIVQESNNDDT
ncbi:5489_t:CDS:2, partial [Cetraspora pellucida]